MKDRIIKRLERIFPELELYIDAKEFNDGKDICSPYTLSWYEFIEILNKNGLTIKENKECT